MIGVNGSFMEGQAMYIGRNMLLDLNRQAASEAGISASYLDFMVDFEPEVREIDGRLEYNTNSRRGSFRGLYQLGAPAWEDAVKTARRLRPDSGLLAVSYPEAAYDPYSNVLAAAFYIRWLLDFLKRKGYTGSRVTPELVYALYNQGPGFLAHAKRGELPSAAHHQSAAAQEVLKRAVTHV
jgi:hypothetical protein